MKFSKLLAAVTVLATALAHPLTLEKRQGKKNDLAAEVPRTSENDIQTSYGKPFAIYQPKAFVVSMFYKERQPWLDELDFVHNITIPGLSPLYPTIFCTTNYTICQITIGEGEINAAASLTALTLSPLFDLTKTYWLIAGIAGGEPSQTTIGSVTFAKYAIQVALEYQVDYREYIDAHPDWTSGYFAFDTNSPFDYPGDIYGTEVFELNENLRDRAFDLALTATLANGTERNAEFRAEYADAAAQALPAVVKCDVLTSDTYFTGNVLNDYFAFFTSLITNGTATYCATAQEDNASLEVFTRLHKYGLVDYDRVVVMRTISDFSRPPPSLANDTVKFFTEVDDGSSVAARANLFNAGFPLIHDIINNWDSVYESGKKYASKNYIGDIYATLGGTPDFGKESFRIT